MQNDKNREVLLKVEHLCQYFKVAHGEFKAVEDVSFDIYRGEVFGLVGESGCGKTTTGRSIIKLYQTTSGNVIFNGVRICAGTRSYKNEMKEIYKNLKALKTQWKVKYKEAKQQLDELVAAKQAEIRARMDEAENLREQSEEAYQSALQAALEDQVRLNEEISENYAGLKDQKANFIQEGKEAYAEAKEKAATEIARLKAEIKSARYDQTHSDRKLVTKIQMIFQDPIASLDPRMTVREIIAEGLKIQGEKNKEVIDEKVFNMLEKVGLVREHASRYPHEFSGGQRQRIGVARAIVMEPDLIIADEPVSALDVSIQAQVINLLNDLRHEMNLTILFVAHDLSVVKYFSDRIGVMYFGKLVELATSDELFKNPLHPYTKSLLSAIPLPDPIYEKNRTRIVYNPLAEHDYTVHGPSMREVAPGHFVYCNDEEEARYKAELERDSK